MTEKKWYKVTFYARMSQDDIHAMNKYLYDTMNEAMEIEECEGLEIELDDEENKDEADFDICLAEDDYELDMATGSIKISTQIFDDFVKDSIIKIRFSDEDDIINEYQMKDMDDEWIYCDFFGDCV